MNTKQARAYAKTVKPGEDKELTRFYNAAREFMDNRNGETDEEGKYRMTYSSLLISKDNIAELWEKGYVIEIIPVVGGSDNYLICW